MIRWVCGFTLKESKKEECRAQTIVGTGIQFSLFITKSGLSQFGHMESKDDADWMNVIQQCSQHETEEHARKIWWDRVKQDKL